MTPKEKIDKLVNTITGNAISYIQKDLDSCGYCELCILNLFIDYSHYNYLLTDSLKSDIIKSVDTHFKNMKWTTYQSNDILYIAETQDWIDQRIIRDSWITRYAKGCRGNREGVTLQPYIYGYGMLLH